MPNEPLRILAVDDVSENLVALEAALEQPGVELVTAQSGFEALELMLKHDFALALLDVQMPEMDGFELAELMRGTERTKGVPIIFLTAIATDERRKFRGFEAGAVDYLLKPLDIMILNSKIAVFVELARQRREIAMQRDELGMALGRLRAYGDNSLLSTMEVDADMRIVSWFKGAERTIGYPMEAVVGQKFAEAAFMVAEESEGFMETIRELLHGKEGRLVSEHRFRRADGSLREGEWYCTALPGGSRKAGSALLSMVDVTERKRAEQTQRLLIGELNHRVKNTLATVQAIASQGMRHARSPQDFQEVFSGRLQSLSRAHSLLSATTWESASLRRLIEEQVAIGAIGAERLRLDGPDVHLPPELALRFSLILHELATNANKYGALSNDTGTVSLSWSRCDEWLRLRWCESGGPTVQPPQRRGFGSTLIRESMAPDGARVEPVFAAEGVCWKLDVPLVAACGAAACDVLDDQVVPATPNISPANDEMGGTAAAGISSAPVGENMSMRTANHAPGSSGQSPASGKRILIVEDEPLVAMELAMEIEDLGGVPIGPATSCDQAVDIIRNQQPDLALLDGNLNGERITPVADELADLSIPFAFVSGYDREHLPENHADRPMIAKPFMGVEVVSMIERLLAPAMIPADGQVAAR